MCEKEREREREHESIYYTPHQPAQLPRSKIVSFSAGTFSGQKKLPSISAAAVLSRQQQPTSHGSTGWAAVLCASYIAEVIAGYSYRKAWIQPDKGREGGRERKRERELEE